VQGSLGILAAINFIGLLTSFMIPETMGKTLEELSCVEALINFSPERDLDMVGLSAETYA
jgi:hypothetical protein